MGCSHFPKETTVSSLLDTWVGRVNKVRLRPVIKMVLKCGCTFRTRSKLLAHTHPHSTPTFTPPLPDKRSDLSNKRFFSLFLLKGNSAHRIKRLKSTSHRHDKKQVFCTPDRHSHLHSREIINKAVTYREAYT